MLRAIVVVLLACLLCHADSQFFSSSLLLSGLDMDTELETETKLDIKTELDTETELDTQTELGTKIRKENVSAIQNLTAKVLDETSVKVEWTALADSIAEYKVSALATHTPPAIVFTRNTSVTFKNLVPGKEYNIRVAEWDGETADARYADVNLTTCDIHPTIGDLRATFINGTSLKVTWGTAHSGMIHINVCSISPYKKNCTQYTTNGDLMKYEIDVVGRDTAYEVRAKLSVPFGYIPCYSEESSVTVKRPAAGGHNSGSSSGVCGLLTLAILLLLLTKSG